MGSRNSDFNANTIISVKLIGTENYRVRAAAMKLDINTRNKTGFIDGSCVKSAYANSPALSNQWERCNSIVLSWLLNSVSEDLFLGQIFSDNASEVWAELKETYDKLDGSITFNLLQKIHGFKQGELIVSEYYHKLNSLWREFDILTKLPKCSCVAREDVSKHKQLIKLMQFLMGLNDVFQPIRSSLLSRETLPDVKDAFAIVFKEESHTGLASSSGSVTKTQVLSFVAKSNNWSNNGNKKTDNNKRFENSGNNRGPNPNLHCTNCQKVRHTVDRCFDIIGYPLGYVKNPGPKSTGTRTFNANSVSSSNEKGASLSFTNEQMLKLINLINDSPSESVQANMAGNQSSVCYVSKSVWHTRLGHPSDQAVDMLHQDLNFTKDSHVSPCDICHKAKQKREPFPVSDHQATSIGELIHFDLWGPYKVISKEGFRYFLTIVDDYTRAVWIYLVKTKDKVYDHFVNYINMILNEFNCSIKTVRSDNAPNDEGSAQPCSNSVDDSEVDLATSMSDNSSSEGSVPSNSSPLLNSSNYCFSTTLNKSTEPTTYSEAIKNPNWIEAMNNEIEALNRNDTWTICDLPPGRKVVGSKWLWKIKYKSTGEIESYKARVVATGFSQREGLT
ncbi:ribonuclease H-like domain-containing protein [Tanacetum coccineum]